MQVGDKVKIGGQEWLRVGEIGTIDSLYHDGVGPVATVTMLSDGRRIEFRQSDLTVVPPAPVDAPVDSEVVNAIKELTNAVNRLADYTLVLSRKAR